MAVYQGARLRTDGMPAAGVSARRARPARPAAPTPAISSPRVRPMGVLMAVIVGATMLGLVYLTQTLGSAATGTDIYWTEKAIADNWRDTQSLQIQISRATGDDNIGPKARKLKLKRLSDPVILKAP